MFLPFINVDYDSPNILFNILFILLVRIFATTLYMVEQQAIGRKYFNLIGEITFGIDMIVV